MKLRNAISDDGEHCSSRVSAFERFGEREIRFGVGERNCVDAVGLVVGRQGRIGLG